VAAKNIANGNSNVYADEGEQMQLTPEAIPIEFNQDVKSDIKKFNFGIQGGIGLQQKLPIGYLTFTAGGNYGFIPIQKDSNNGQNNTGAATLTIGYLLKI
jgi:hypothetical protein